MSRPYEGQVKVKIHRISFLAIKSGWRWYHFCSVLKSSHFRIWPGDQVNWLRFLVVFLGRYSENARLVPHITCISYFIIIVWSYETIIRESSVGIVIMVGGGKRQELWFDSEQAGDIFPSSETFRADGGLTQPLVQRVSGKIYPRRGGGVMCPMREADHSLPSNVEINP